MLPCVSRTPSSGPREASLAFPLGCGHCLLGGRSGRRPQGRRSARLRRFDSTSSCSTSDPCTCATRERRNGLCGGSCTSDSILRAINRVRWMLARTPLKQTASSPTLPRHSTPDTSSFAMLKMELWLRTPTLLQPHICRNTQDTATSTRRRRAWLTANPRRCNPVSANSKMWVTKSGAGCGADSAARPGPSARARRTVPGSPPRHPRRRGRRHLRESPARSSRPPPPLTCPASS